MSRHGRKRGSGIPLVQWSVVLSHWREATSVILRVAYSGLALLVTVLLARLLSPAELGKYFEVIAWVLLIGMAVQTGWAPFLVREVAALREQARFGTLAGIAWLAIRLVSGASIAAALIMIAVAYFTGTDPRTMALFLMGAAVIPLLSTSSVRQAVTRGMGHPLLGQICENLTRPGVQLALLLCWWLGLLGPLTGPSTAMMIFLLAIAASGGLAFLLERRATASARKSARRAIPPRSEWLSSLTRNALIGWSTAANLQVGTLVLANAASDPEVATFRIAQQLSLLLALGLNALITVYAPALSRAFARDDLRAMQILANKGAFISSFAAAPLAITYILFGSELLEFVYGSRYAGAYTPLVLLSLGQLANAGFGLVTVVAVATRSEATALRAHLLGAIANLVLCVLLVPQFGAAGAATASAISMILWNILIFLHLRRKFGISSFIGWR